MKTELEGDLTPEELCQFIMKTIETSNGDLHYKRNEERKRERRLKRKLEALDLILKMEGWD